jgi:hypothetical protein
MKKIQLFISVLSILLVTNFQINAKTFQNSKNRDLPKFTSVKLAIGANVYLTQSNKQSFRIEASEKLIQLIETEVKNGKLIIKWTKRNVRHSEKIKIYISMEEIEGVAISGSGDIIADGKIKTDKIDLAISGSGDISFSNLEANDIKSRISGSADIYLAGSQTANSLSVAISGSGDVKAVKLPVKNVSIKISGSGDCKVNVIDRLDATVSGSGDIYYKGRPVINGKVAGSGSIKSMD